MSNKLVKDKKEGFDVESNISEFEVERMADFEEVEETIESKIAMRNQMVKLLEENNSLISTTNDLQGRLKLKQYLESEIEKKNKEIQEYNK